MKLNCADVLTLITGNLFVPMDRLYTLYNGLTGDNLFTHQLPRAFRACEPVARAQWPEIADDMSRVVIGPENYLAVLSQARAQWGDEFEMEPLEDWTSIDPLAEAHIIAGDAARRAGWSETLQPYNDPSHKWNGPKYHTGKLCIMAKFSVPTDSQGDGQSVEK